MDPAGISSGCEQKEGEAVRAAGHRKADARGRIGQSLISMPKALDLIWWRHERRHGSSPKA
jgi:hypothetical protein